MNNYKGYQVKPIPDSISSVIKVRGWFSFSKVIYIHHDLIDIYNSQARAVHKSEYIQTAEHEYHHIKQLERLQLRYGKYIGMVKFLWHCLPNYKASWIEQHAIKAGNIAKIKYIVEERNKKLPNM